MGEVTIRVVDMGYGVEGCVCKDADGDYSVYINARLTTDKQRKALEHELQHIENNDFYNGLPIQLVEDA